MTKTKILKLNKPLAGLSVGTELKIKVDKDGAPLDQYWRRRLADSSIDGCVEFIKEKKQTAKKEDN